MANEITIGATVKHPSRGVGTIATIETSPLFPGRVIAARVDFPFVGTATRRYRCIAEDLTLVPKPVAAEGRPSLTVVEPTAPSAA